MKTVDKALSVLDQFSTDKTEIGLSELSRMAGLDKAATRRLLVALAKHQFIEQVAETRKYRLGHGFLRLARIREATVPILRAAEEVCQWLGGLANETAHVCVPGSKGMTTIAFRLPNRGNVINLIPSQLLHFHATASGLAYLSWASRETARRILELPREKFTDVTLTDPDDLQVCLDKYKTQGFSQTHNTFETGVASIAMPFFQSGEDPAGAIALALPDNDLTDMRRDELLPVLKDAVQKMQTALRGS